MTAPEFPIIGVGASAGGIDAFHSFFDHMPPDCGMAFVMILHLPADRKSMLTEILRRWTSMKVVEGEDGALIEPNCVYVPPPHAVVTLTDGHLGVQMPPADSERILRPIDRFFDSLGTALRERAVGIVLSGTGSDGALGLKAIKAYGGLTIAQGTDGSAPQYPEMPAGAIATGAVDLVAPVQDMPGHLMRMKNNAAKEAPTSSDEKTTDALRLEICALVREQLGHDFRGYRSRTFLRRVERRMQIVNAPTLQDYVATLKKVPSEATLLFRDLLIRVTSFFRDEETFKVLEAKVIPRLFDGKKADSTVRVWVPGCATGEEAYSLAILLREYMAELNGAPKVQIFATDIDEAAIAAARLGRYPATLIEGLSPERRDRFFTLSHGSYVVTKDIRDLCTFSAHDLVSDPPFSLMNLVSCRNLLIYMDPELQARIIPVFHYALAPKGILVLGAAESVVQHAELFETMDKVARVFQKRDVRSPALNLNWERSRVTAAPDAAGSNSNSSSSADRRGAYRSAVIDRSRAPPVMNERARSDRFASILKRVEPSPEIVSQLQAALASTCEELQSLSEQYQTALEELRSANEELHSVNEEMQSTNEELETSKEELQSLNEELHTVNVRLSEKIEELDQSNSDLRNLFESTEIATVFLDRFLIIRSYTPAIASLYNLIPSDQGRPLTDIRSRLRYDSLREDVAFVLSNLEPLERRVVRDDGAVHYIMRILPYRKPDSTVSGVLVTFVDITSIVQAEAALIEADVRKDVFLATLSHELRNPLAPIRTAAQILQSPKLQPEELHRAQAIIARQVGHMSSLLDDLLDVSRITRGAFLLKKAYVDLQTLIDEAVEEVQPEIDKKQHTLRVERPSGQITLEVDPVRLTQVLTNLLTNAAKYSPPGGLVTLGSRFEANMLELFVRDNGVGLASDSLTKVFTMFTQDKSDVRRSEGGLGIGLALAKGLVELHGGRIEARSKGVGHGSEFVVLLPRTLVVDSEVRAPKDAVKPASHITRRVLIADDNRDGAETLSVLLKHWGHEVHVAYSGKQALELSKRVRPQIAVLDIGMPDMSGYEVAERIRAEAWGNEVTLIALTGWGQEEDKRRARVAGFDHHLTKPVDPIDLHALIDDPKPV